MTAAATRVRPSLPRSARAGAADVSHGPERHPWGVVVMLRLFFWTAPRALWVPRLLRQPAIWVAVWVSGAIRQGTAANYRRIVGRAPTRREHGRFARAVVARFFDFVVDVGRAQGAAAWQGRVADVHGQRAYLASRKSGRGAMLVTLHMGSFEAGLAALRGVERDVSVVFLRDRFADFEASRRRLREGLGVREIALDDGLAALAAIPAALRRNGVVVMQGDRAYPGQRSQVVPFLHGRLRLPLGPVRIARMCGSPIVPVASVRRPDGRFDIHLGTPVPVSASGDEPAGESGGTDGIDPAVRAIARAFERLVAADPTQWLALRPAFVEDELEPKPEPADA